METYIVENIEASPSDSEGLAYVYFDFGNFDYFTICFSEEEQDKIYIEKSEQTQSVYSNNLSYKLNSKDIIFEFDDEISSKIGTDKSILLKLNLDQSQLHKLETSLKAIFRKDDA